MSEDTSSSIDKKKVIAKSHQVSITGDDTTEKTQIKQMKPYSQRVGVMIVEKQPTIDSQSFDSNEATIEAAFDAVTETLKKIKKSQAVDHLATD